MNRSLQFYNYEASYFHYTRLILNIRQAKKYGETIVAKPVLLLALIDGIEDGVFSNNLIQLNEWLEKRYETLMRIYTRHSIFPNITEINNPFWHLESDGFWHLNYPGERLNKSHTPSKAWLKENVEFAYFDESLWILLQNKVWRTKMRDYIIEHKLTDDSWKGKIAAEGLGIVAALLLTA